MRFVSLLAVALVAVGSVRLAAQDAPPKLPTEAEVAELVAKEPVTAATWPAWKERLIGWSRDNSHATQAAFDAAMHFVQQHAADDRLAAPLDQDFYAWYLLGHAQLRSGVRKEDLKQQAPRVQKSLEESIRCDGTFPRTHRLLGFVLLVQGQQPAAEQAFDRARQLDPNLSLSGYRARAALLNEQPALALPLFRTALQEDPTDEGNALGVAQTSTMLRTPQSPSNSPELAGLVDRFPNSGPLHCLYAVGLAQDGKFRPAVEELKAAKKLGADPEQILSAQTVRQIERLAAPGWFELLVYVMAGFAAVYAVIMLGMVVVAWGLALWTRGADVSAQLAEGETIQLGKVVATRGESVLARLYSFALVCGLVMFYVALPFVILGLLGVTAGLIYFMFTLPRVSIKLVLIVLIIGGMMAWAVLKSLFVSTGKGSFGIKKTREEEPRIHALLADVAAKVDTTPMDEVYLSPGADVGVHQTGRGPFGIFGVKQRVLTLGLVSLQCLSVEELSSVLAHEYAHFTHGDTFFHRFIHQVTLSINASLSGMGQAGGRLNYVNPFFWFLYGYYRAYSMMAAGFSRSREFLADRMAASLYGSNVFRKALARIATQAAYSETMVFNNVHHFISQNQAFENVYDAIRQHEQENPENAERDQGFEKSLNEKGSLFASHPTVRERFAAVSGFPEAPNRHSPPAVELLQDPAASEKQLTEFLTTVFHQARQAELAAAQA